MDEEEGDDGGGLLSSSSFGAAAGGGVADDLVDDRVDDLLGYIATYYSLLLVLSKRWRVSTTPPSRFSEILMRFKLI